MFYLQIAINAAVGDYNTKSIFGGSLAIKYTLYNWFLKKHLSSNIHYIIDFYVQVFYSECNEGGRSEKLNEHEVFFNFKIGCDGLKRLN